MLIAQAAESFLRWHGVLQPFGVQERLERLPGLVILPCVRRPQPFAGRRT